MMGRQRKRETTFHPIINQYRNKTEKKKTDTQVQTPAK
jgi:hypothetical protein